MNLRNGLLFAILLVLSVGIGGAGYFVFFSEVCKNVISLENRDGNPVLVTKKVCKKRF